jgi:hypothetical protein
VPSSGKSRNDTRKDNDSCVGEEGMKGGEWGTGTGKGTKDGMGKGTVTEDRKGKWQGKGMGHGKRKPIFKHNPGEDHIPCAVDLPLQKELYQQHIVRGPLLAV